MNLNQLTIKEAHEGLKEKKFSKYNDINVKTSSGAYVVLLSRVHFNEEQKIEIGNKLGISK